jgi:hypothetical protein
MIDSYILNMGLTPDPDPEAKELTGFHPVRDKKVEKNPSLGINLRVCGIVMIPT